MLGFSCGRLRSRSNCYSDPDWQLLDLCHDLTEPFEVGKRSRFEWEETILKTFEIWRKVQNHGGGWVRFDRKSRTVEFLADKPIM
jgi:hypothetical protein